MARDDDRGPPRTSWPRPIGWLFAAGVFLVTYYAFFFRPEDVSHAIFLNSVFLVLPAFTGAVCLVAGARALPSTSGWSWIFIGLGCLAWSFGQLVWLTYDIVWRIPVPYPSLAEVGFLLMYPLFAAGLILLIRRNMTGSPPVEVVLDTLILASVSAITASQFLIEPILAAGAESVPALLAALFTAFGTSCIVFLTLVAFVLSNTWVGRRSLLLLLLGASLFSIADLVYFRLAIEGTYELGHLIDLGWLVGFLLVAIAAHLAGRHQVVQPLARTDERDPTMVVRMVVVLVSVLVGTWMSLFADVRDGISPLTAVGFATIALLIAARIAYATIVSQRLLMRTQERDRLLAELATEVSRAATIQAQLLPQFIPEVPGYEIAAVCLPSRAVGGDFYDWQPQHDGALRLTLGDVMGKGMAASLLMATALAALRAVITLPLAEAVESVNRALSPGLMLSDSFITLFHAVLEPTSGALSYVDAGHGLVFIQRQDGRVESLRQHSLPLGVLADQAYPAGTTMLEPGDTLVIYSDGLQDAHPERAFEEVEIAQEIGGLASAQAKKERLVHLVSDVQVRPDDLTLVLVRRMERQASRRLSRKV